MKEYDAYRPEGLSALTAFLIIAEAAPLPTPLTGRERTP
jgi:hypothetical protein